jgi:hypothetical protein
MNDKVDKMIPECVKAVYEVIQIKRKEEKDPAGKDLEGGIEEPIQKHGERLDKNVFLQEVNIVIEKGYAKGIGISKHADECEKNKDGSCSYVDFYHVENGRVDTAIYLPGCIYRYRADSSACIYSQRLMLMW